MSPINRFVHSVVRTGVLLVIALGRTSKADELLYDGFGNIASLQREVRGVEEVSRSPLFDNAPFLHLRAGDKLVKAKDAISRGKPMADPDRISYYLSSGGKYYQLWTTEEDAKLELSSAFHSAYTCLLFDWEPTIANARELRKLLPSAQVESIPLQQYEKTLWAVRRQFPDLDYTFDTFNPTVGADRLVTIPGQAKFEFQGISFDSFGNRFHRYTVSIGPHVCQIVGELLLQGPPRVDRSEFMRVDIPGPNGNPGQDVDPKVAKVKKAAYDRMVQFNTLVWDHLSPNPLKPK